MPCHLGFTPSNSRAGECEAMKRLKLTGWGWFLVIGVINIGLYAAIASVNYARGYEAGYRDGQYWVVK